MRILIIGGTRFVGRRIVEALAAAGHELTLLNRGRSEPPVAGAQCLVADREDHAAVEEALREGSWDAVVDVCAYTSDQVESLARALGGRGGRYLLISTISVYDAAASQASQGSRLDEDGPLLAPIAGRAAPDVDAAVLYGARKVACEQVAHERFDELTIVRPGIVAGSLDPTGRFSWYPERWQAAGETDSVELAGTASQPMQVIDARDLGAFVARLVADSASGTFNATGHDAGRTLGDIVAAAAEATGTSPEVAWLGDDGPEHPLYIPATEPALRLFEIDPVRGRDAGLVCRPLVETARDVLEAGAP